ncbi:6291_t:CDS:2 [Paraglomus occultum]|uniref:6291_t:CDS:1 n=1 Tax=Paraglomus occultum TaxID=144539 RepID=A0A9N9CDZ7_9GLOM|nr:6291_t:CDS:2 [Paraglomus occultum]
MFIYVDTTCLVKQITETTAHDYIIVQCHASAYNFVRTHIKLLIKLFIPLNSVQTPVYKPNKDDVIKVFGSITNIKDDICEISAYRCQNTCYDAKSLPQNSTHIICMGILNDQPQLQESYWNFNLSCKQFVGKNTSGIKCYECDILCSRHESISRLTGRSASAKKGSRLIITGEIEVSENQLYCDLHHFEFASQAGQGLKRDTTIWVQNEEDNDDLSSPSRRYKKPKQKSTEKEFEKSITRPATPSPSHIESASPSPPATVVSDASSSAPLPNEKKTPSRRQSLRRRA